MSLAWLAAFFLPLFPMSIVLTGIFTRLRQPILRALLILIWPQVGIVLLYSTHATVPEALVPWGIVSAAFYALRMLTVRELDRWSVFCAVSGLGLIWGLAATGVAPLNLALFALWFSLPAALLTLLSGPLVRRFGAAYVGLCTGWGGSLPFLSALLIATALAAIATPPFPGFFGMLSLMHRLNLAGMVGVLLIWLVWGWAAARLLQGFVFGTRPAGQLVDIKRLPTVAYTVILGGFTFAGLYFARGGL